MRRHACRILAILLLLSWVALGYLVAGAMQNKREMEDLKRNLRSLGVDGLHIL